MKLLRLITLPYVRKHKLRSLLTLAGIILGVAVFVAMRTANEAVVDGFQKTVERIAGRAQLQVSAGEAGLDESVLDLVRNVAGVRAAVPTIEATVQPARAGEGSLLILGIDMLGDAALRNYDFEGAENAADDPLVFLAQPDSLIITHEFAQRNGLTTGAKLPLETMDGAKQFTVRGILQSGGMTSAFGGNLAIMDIYAAQKIFGRGRKFDRIDIVLENKASVTQAQEALRQSLGPGFTVQPPEQRSQNFEALLGGYSALVGITSAFALLMSSFVIYNSFSIALTQRRFEIGLLRALGATRGQIRNLFLLESAIAGFLGSAGGIALGLLAAKTIERSTLGMVTALAGMEPGPPETFVSTALLAAAAMVGMVTSVLAAWIPARNAARLDPVYALQRGKAQMFSPAESRLRVILALGAIAGSVLCLLAPSRSLLYAAYGLIVIAAVLSAPPLAILLARTIRGLLTLLSPVEGALAVDSIINAPYRTSATVTGLMLAVAIAVAMSGVAKASLASIDEWVTTVFNADLLVSTSESLNARSFHFPGTFEAQLAAVPGVAAVQPIRTFLVPLNGSPVMIIGVEMRKIAALQQTRHVIAGNRAEMYGQAEEARGLIASENLMLLQKLRLGDRVDLATPSGSLRLPIVGVVRDYSNQTGAIYVELSVLRRYWKDDSLDLLQVYLRPGVDAREARRHILEQFQNQNRMFVFLNADLRKYVLNVGNQWFAIADVQIAVAALVAVLGIVNTLTVSIIDRRRELGILRAVGGLRNQVRQTLWLEAVTIAFLGVVLGLSFGAVNLYYQLEAVRRSVIANPLDYQFPAGIALGLFPALLGVAWLSAVVPAESAVRTPLAAALENE
jgi:putative ABC transport system permease protein